MASAKYQNFIAQNNSGAFDHLYRPGAVTPYSGIYRCAGCARSVVSEATRPLPPQNHHQHTVAQGAIRWQLLVVSTDRNVFA